MIRQAVEDDIPHLVEWMKKLVLHAQETSHDPYIVNIAEGYEAEFAPLFLNVINSDSGVIYIAEEQDIPVGFILGNITTPFLKASAIKSIGQIELCWVEKNTRKKGVARKLCSRIELWFKEAGIQYIDLHYLAGNDEAEMSWKKLGYQPYRITSRKEI